MVEAGGFAARDQRRPDAAEGWRTELPPGNSTPCIHGDSIFLTTWDKSNGEFMLAFLPEGLYTVSVRDTLDQAFEKNDVLVVAGADSDLGLITLQ